MAASVDTFELFVYYCLSNLLSRANPSQQTHNVVTTSLQRRCNVTTLQRRCNDVVATLCVCWVVFFHCVGGLPYLPYNAFTIWKAYYSKGKTFVHNVRTFHRAIIFETNKTMKLQMWHVRLDEIFRMLKLGWKLICFEPYLQLSSP